MAFERFEKDGCIIHVIDKTRVHAWTDGGSFAYYIRPLERDMFRFDPERALNHMLHKVNKGIRRCSECGWEGPRKEFATLPMADILCLACATDRARKLDEEYKNGDVCHFCKKPRSICTC